MVGVGLIGSLVASSNRVFIALRSIYGIGRSRSEFLCSQLGVYRYVRVGELQNWQFELLRVAIHGSFVIEAELRQRIVDSIDRLKFIKCYRGIRHIKLLPCRGQRTVSNAKTRKRLRRHA